MRVVVELRGFPANGIATRGVAAFFFNFNKLGGASKVPAN